MKKIIFSLLSVVAVLSVSAQKVMNDVNAEKRTVAAFHAVQVGGGIDLYYSEGDNAVAVSASEEKYRARIVTEVVNGVLKISYDHGTKIGWNTGKMKLRAYVSAKTLDQLKAGGGSDVIVDGTIRGNQLEVVVSGGSDFKGNIEATALTLRASGGSDISVSGSARSLELHASGGSDIDGYGLAVEQCVADATGGSDITVTVSKEISAQASGGSDVHYRGEAVVKTSQSNGGSSVKKVR